MRLEHTSYSENIVQKNICAKKISFPMSTSRSGSRVKYHDIVRVRHNKKRETLIKGRIKCQHYVCGEEGGVLGLFKLVLCIG